MIETVLTVHNIKFVTKTIFELQLSSKTVLPKMLAGQFLHLKVPGSEPLLRRPFCLYKFEPKSITLLIAVLGRGTKMLSSLKKGDEIMAILPIGNGFTLKPNHQKVALIGGGVGIAPLCMVAPTNSGKQVNAYLGFTNKQNALDTNAFSKTCNKAVVTTDDGTLGLKGNPIKAFLDDYNSGYKPDVILTCGSHGLLKAVKAMCAKYNIEAYMSGEERMGCGVGACLVCACAVKKGSEIQNLRACVDGPVFNIAEVVL